MSDSKIDPSKLLGIVVDAERRGGLEIYTWVDSGAFYADADVGQSRLSYQG